MARTVHKFEVSANNAFGPVELPIGARIVHTDVQHTRVFVWALVDPAAETTDRLLGYFATGHLVPEQGLYIGSCPDREFGLVWHVFEGIEPEREAASDLHEVIEGRTEVPA